MVRLLFYLSKKLNMENRVRSWSHSHCKWLQPQQRMALVFRLKCLGRDEQCGLIPLQGLAPWQDRRALGWRGAGAWQPQKPLGHSRESSANNSSSVPKFSSTPLKQGKEVLPLHWNPDNFHFHLPPMFTQILLSLFSVLMPFFTFLFLFLYFLTSCFAAAVSLAPQNKPAPLCLVPVTKPKGDGRVRLAAKPTLLLQGSDV